MAKRPAKPQKKPAPAPPPPKAPPGPEPEHLKLEGDWQENVKKALQKKRPAEGWPDEGTKAKK